MLYSLILLLTLNDKDYKFVLDTNLSRADCAAQVAKFENTGQKTAKVWVANTYYCEVSRGK